MNATTAQALTEIDRDAQRRKAAILQAEQQAAAVVAANALSEQQQQEQAARAALLATSAATWENDRVPALQSELAAVAASAQQLKEIYSQIKSLFDAAVALHPKVSAATLNMAEKIARERAAMPDAHLIDLVAAVEEATDLIVGDIHFSIGVPTLIEEAYRGKNGGVNGINSQTIYEYAPRFAREALKRGANRA